MVTRKPEDPADEVPSVVDLIAFKSQRISLYSHALEAQRQATADNNGDPETKFHPLLSTEGLMLASKLIEDVAYSFATRIPEQEVIGLLSLSAKIEREMHRLDGLDLSQR